LDAVDGARESVRVLIVDDEPLVREAVEVCLTPLGHQVTPAGGVEHARIRRW